MNTQKTTIGLIVGNRGFFPSHLCRDGREEMIRLLGMKGFEVVTLTPEEARHGSIESLEEARRCAALFDENRHRIDGIIVTLPNFGDERAIANAISLSGLKVPVLVHAWPDEAGNMTIRDRRDSFCGKMSTCNNLHQFGIPFTLTRLHTCAPSDDAFTQDLADFDVTCRVLRALKGLRVGALGARPAAFNTVRYSEKLLQNSGITVETLDLFELFGRVERLKESDPVVQQKLASIREYASTKSVAGEHLVKMARFGVAVDQWMKECDLHATAIQCWTAMEEFFGAVPCTCMSMMSNMLNSSACEVDITGAVSMHILAAAAGRPSAIVDWNNNYGADPDKAVIFHCSNLPRDVFVGAGEAKPEMRYQEIIAGSVGEENTYGTIYGRVKASPFTYLRLSTSDTTGRINVYLGEGELTNDPLETFGGYGVVRVPRFQELLRHICENGFEHHVSINLTTTARGIGEALRKYLGWNVYHHE